MKKDKQKKNIAEAKAQTAAPTKSKAKGKHQPAVKNNVTDIVMELASQTPGRNQSKTRRQDLLPLN